MQVVLPDVETRARIEIDCERPMDDEEYFAFCAENRKLRIERVLNSRLAQLTKEQKKRFLYLCPDLVVELLSPSDRPSKVQAKMQVWIENGAALAWLIDADQRTVYIYRPGKNPELLTDIDHVDGEAPVAGFRLELTDIWQGL